MNIDQHTASMTALIKHAENMSDEDKLCMIEDLLMNANDSVIAEMVEMNELEDEVDYELAMEEMQANGEA